jgi:hypothetical protein
MEEMVGALAEVELSQPLLRIASTDNLEMVAMVVVGVVVLAPALMMPITLYKGDRVELAEVAVVEESTNLV